MGWPSPLVKETTFAPTPGASEANESGSASGSTLRQNFSGLGTSGALSPPGNAGDLSALFVLQCMSPCLEEYRLSCRELRGYSQGHPGAYPDDRRCREGHFHEDCCPAPASAHRRPQAQMPGPSPPACCGASQRLPRSHRRGGQGTLA